MDLSKRRVDEGNSSIEIELNLSRAREALIEVQKKESKHAETVAEKGAMDKRIESGG